MIYIIFELLILPVVFYFFVNSFTNLKINLKLSPTYLESSNYVKKYLIYILNCTKCSSFQLSLLLNILLKFYCIIDINYLFIFILSCAISFITLQFEHFYFQHKLKRLRNKYKFN